MLDAEIDRPAIARRFETALKSIRSHYRQVGEDKVMVDVLQVAHQARKAEHAKNRA